MNEPMISHFDGTPVGEIVEDGDLILLPRDGMAYQRDLEVGRVTYDDAYFKKYREYETTPIAGALNQGRIDMLRRHCLPGDSVLDYGAGCGTFVRWARVRGYRAFGFDICPATVEHLAKLEAYSENVEEFDVVTFWDSLEHLDYPDLPLRRIKVGAHVLVAIPLFEDLRRIRESKHYRPGEHLYYWSTAGFLLFMRRLGYRFIEGSGHEVEAGRAQIGAFAFVRELA